MFLHHQLQQRRTEPPSKQTLLSLEQWNVGFTGNTTGLCGVLTAESATSAVSHHMNATEYNGVPVGGRSDVPSMSQRLFLLSDIHFLLNLIIHKLKMPKAHSAGVVGALALQPEGHEFSGLIP